MKIQIAFRLLPLLACGTFLNTACTMKQTRGTGEYGPSYYTSDAGVAERVQVALKSQPDVNLRTIKVETFQGMVQVSGQVESHSQAVRTIAALNRVDGVKTVRSYLVENPPKRIAPRPVVGPATAVARAPGTTPQALVVASNSSGTRLSVSKSAAGTGK